MKVVWRTRSPYKYKEITDIVGVDWREGFLVVTKIINNAYTAVESISSNNLLTFQVVK